MKTEAQSKNDARDAVAKEKKRSDVPDSAMSVKFFELFNMSLPRVYELDWENNHREFHIYPVLDDVATRWFQSHPAAGVIDVCRIITSVLRKNAVLRYQDHHSADALRVRSRHS
jgi:hypothetical protein